ncbi:MAG: class I SAM-dependent methyltransferase [Planctomycetota bacterium]|jgi:hypothetical protein
MRDELRYIIDKHDLNVNGKLYVPIEIPQLKRIDGLAPLFAELDYKIGVEVGVERGEFLEVLCVANPQAKIYGVDAWAAYRGYRDHVSQEKLDGFYGFTIERMQPYNCELMRDWSVSAAERFDNESLDFVYIDANHRLEETINDIVAWERKVRRGGIVSGHDYRQFKRQTYSHIVEALGAYTHAYRIHPWFLCGKRSEPKGVRDTARSWFWVKE